MNDTKAQEAAGSKTWDDKPATYEPDQWYDATIKTVKYNTSPKGTPRLMFVLTNPQHGTLFHDENVTPETKERIQTLLCERFGLSLSTLASPEFWQDPSLALKGLAVRIKTGLYKDKVEVKVLTTSKQPAGGAAKPGASEESVMSAASLFGAESSAASAAFFGA